MRRGFTLIELLAVIVVLAIIALIAVPIVINIIGDVKEESLKRSVKLYLDTVEKNIANQQTKNIDYHPDECVIQNNGNIVCSLNEEVLKINGENTELEISMSGEKPIGGSIKLENGKIVDIININLSGEYYGFDEEKNVILTGFIAEELAPGLYDSNYNLIASWDEFVQDYPINIEEDYSENIGGPILLNSGKYSQTSILVISSKVTKIGSNAFSNCTNLKKVIIPNSVTSIGNYAFENCTNLLDLTLGNGIISIEVEAFSGCSKLTNIKIPSNVTIIEDSAFSDCTNLKSVVFDNNSSLTTIEMDAFANTALSSITLPDSLEYIGSGAFYNTPLTSIVIPNNVYFIGSGAFYECSNLESVSFEEENYWIVGGEIVFSSSEEENYWISGGEFEFSPSELKNSTINAEYFKEVYWEYNWIRE